MKHALVVVTSFVFVIANTGCGGDDGGSGGGAGAAGGGSSGNGSSAACDKVAACGGDIVGEWKITAVCVEPPSVKDLCESASVTIGSTKASGSASFKADKTVSINATVDATATLMLPASCLMQGSKTLTCKEIQDVLMTDPTAKQISCTTDGAGCKCTNPYHESATNMGTYTSSGNSAMLTLGKDTTSADYCVKDSMLHMKMTSSSGDLPSGQITLMK